MDSTQTATITPESTTPSSQPSRVPLGDELRRIGTVHEFRRGDVIDDGVVLPRVWFVLSGSCRATVEGGPGKQLVVRLLERGDVIGDEHLLPGAAPVPGHRVVADAPTRLLGVPAEQARALLGRRPDFAIAVLDGALKRARASEDLAASVAYQNVDQRFARLLLRLDDRHGEPTLEGYRRLAGGWSQEQLGAMVGVSRKAIVCALASLRRRGIVRTRGRSIELLDVVALEREAGGSQFTSRRAADRP